MLSILANANMEQYGQVVSTLSDGLASDGSNADAVADTFICATAHWPDANPSDLWTFLVSRIYGDPSNHPPESGRLNLEQSWKRTSGWALERVLVRRYADALGKRGIGLKIGSKAEKQQLLGPINDARILPDKADVLITHGSGGQDDALLGVVHVKASLAERRTDDVPMSQALIEAGFLSVFWTMDAKSFPSAHPVNRGEFGAAEGDISDKRRDFEEHGHFSACFSYNSNTVPTANDDATAAIHICDFKSPDDQFVQFLIDAHRLRS